MPVLAKCQQIFSNVTCHLLLNRLCSRCQSHFDLPIPPSPHYSCTCLLPVFPLHNTKPTCSDEHSSGLSAGAATGASSQSALQLVPAEQHTVHRTGQESQMATIKHLTLLCPCLIYLCNIKYLDTHQI